MSSTSDDGIYDSIHTQTRSGQALVGRESNPREDREHIAICIGCGSFGTAIS